ncbi:FemAB family PEP-CTERM system-associated protein [Rhodoferax sp. 4810]|uniref:FemAB family PEP-CTERM system-associated protein n=1 Tax=Thiospirillum jenense TaxID=1653858 RepID=A0A839HGE1_9GAMM|nr:FemAB family XrtA/PEP-CTERM system-associated protein [Thiospirillum jenense]MBB1078076.1 FemAB family PEP-CTERM system-associated protein [Rhodoferax jenense]MBB1127404.1 FemAB family PEP-CTERM system-associated protein [Thiospirillum jenense]
MTNHTGLFNFDDVRILNLTDSDHARWDAYVMQQPAATFFHRAGWQTVLTQSFNHPTYFLYAELNGAICGILPLAHIRSHLFGNSLISTPFCVYGGAIADNESIATQLEQSACQLAERLKVDYLELRHSQRRHPDWLCKDQLYVTFRKRIESDPEQNLLAIPRKQRAMVRKGIAAGLVSHVNSDVKQVYRVYAESVRNLGTPVFSLRYFQTLKTVFGDACEALTIHHGSQIIAGVLNFYFRDQVLPYYGGGTTQARAMKANDFMYWEVMRRACESGYRVFDYGRSKRNTGSYDFKCNWGFEPEPLSYEYYLVQSRQLPDINPLNPKYRLFIRVWKQLPLPVSQFLGPFLSRSLG